MKNMLVATTGVFLVVSLTAAPTTAQDDAALIASAEKAAPAAVSSGAAVYATGADGAMRTLRESSNGWWCMPDSPATPGPDPMCGDANAMEWAMAWIGHTDPPPEQCMSVHIDAQLR